MSTVTKPTDGRSEKVHVELKQPASLFAGQSRLISLDFFRGFTMFFLIAEATGIYDLLVSPQLNGTIISAIGTQFHHHPWNGLRFWDLIQPFFMFIFGVRMPFSYGSRG